MSRILCVWELGGGYGHVAALAPLAQALRARGHEVTLALKDLFYAERILGPTGLDYVQAPVWQHPPRDLPEPVNYAEILFHVGYLNAGNLLGLVKAWRQLYHMLRPDLILVDHAPTALLAARGLNIRTVTYGTGFFAPPRTMPMPSIRPWQQVPAERLSNSESRALFETNQVLRTLGESPLDRLADLLAVDHEFLATFPELDHYGQRVGSDYCGPRFTRDAGATPRWPEGAGPRVFAYLKPQFRDFAAVIAALRVLPCRALVHAPGLSADERARLSGPQLRFSEQPVHMAEVATQSDLALCHAGHGSVAALLLGGCPLLLLPMQPEQALVARRVEALGAGRAIYPEHVPPDYAQLVTTLLADGALHASATAFAEQHADFDEAKQFARITACCEALLT